MSIKTTRFKRKITQLRRKNPGAETSKILPFARVRGAGRMTTFAAVDTIDEEGRLVRAGKRGRPRPSNFVCTEPVKTEKAARLMALVK